MKLGRRGFLGLLAGTLVAPATPWQKLVAWPTRVVRVPVRYLMARIRITETVMQDAHGGAFVAAMRAEHVALMQDLARRENYAFREGRRWHFGSLWRRRRP